MNRYYYKAAAVTALVFEILPGRAGAADAQQELSTPSVLVVGTTPLASVGVTVDQVPANVQIGTSKEIKDQAPSNVADFLSSKFGSVSLSNGSGNPYQNDVSYRGFQATSLLGAPVGLSVYVDGVRYNEAFGSTINWDQIPMNAISSIDVIPGSNPLFGLNTLGGALAINTKNGADNPGVSITQMGGSWGRTGTSLEAGGADHGSNLDYFVSMNYDRQDGYRDYSSSDVRQLFGKTRWHSDDDQRKIELSLALADNELNGTQALPMSMLNNTNQAYTWPDTIKNKMAVVNLKASDWLTDSNLISGGVFYRNQDSTSLNSNAALDDGCGSTGCTHSAPGGTALNGVTVSSNPYDLQRYTGDINTSNVSSSTVQNTVGVNGQFSNFDKLFSHNNNVTLGGLWDHSHISYGQDTLMARLINYETVTTPNLRYYIPSTGGTTGTNQLGAVNLYADTSDYSLFVTDTFEIVDKLNLTASGSYNVATINQIGGNAQFLNDDGGYNWTDSVSGVTYYNPAFIGSKYYSGSTLKTAAIPAHGIAGPETSSLDGKHRYNRFNPAIGLTYNPVQSLGFFGGYSESMRAPTAVELSCANPNSPCTLPTGFNGDPDLKAVVARTAEVGARGKLFGNRVTWNAALYNTLTANDIQFIYATPTSGYFNNVGTTRRRGAEFGIEGKFDRLFLSANYGFVDATFRSSFLVGSSSNSSANADGAIQVAKGDRIPGIADQTLKLRAAYDLTPNWGIGANLLLVSGQYAHGDENNKDANGRLPGYGILNLDTHYDVDENWRVFGLINNALNKQYYTYGLVGQNIYSNASEQFRTPGSPIAVWVGVTYSFGGAETRKSSPADRE